MLGFSTNHAKTVRHTYGTLFRYADPMGPWNMNNPLDAYAAYRLSQRDASCRTAAGRRTTVISGWAVIPFLLMATPVAIATLLFFLWVLFL